MAIWANLECGSLLPLSARLLAGALWAGGKLPAQKAGASSRTPYRDDFDVPLGDTGVRRTFTPKSGTIGLA